MNVKALLLALAVFASPAMAQSSEGTPVSKCLAVCVAGALKSVSSSPCLNQKLGEGFDKCLEGEACPENAQVRIP